MVELNIEFVTRVIEDFASITQRSKNDGLPFQGKPAKRRKCSMLNMLSRIATKFEKSFFTYNLKRAIMMVDA